MRLHNFFCNSLTCSSIKASLKDCEGFPMPSRLTRQMRPFSVKNNA